MAPPDIELLHDGGGMLAVHKPAGLLVHRSAIDAQEADDLVSRLRQQLGAPVWLVHRLDKGTSGVLALGRSAQVASTLAAAWNTGQVHKQYLALVRGWPSDHGQTDQPLARDPELPSQGQPQLPASTRWQLLRRLELPLQTHPDHTSTRLALLLVTPTTGRRHQIRRHFKQLGHPLVGDATHGKGPLNRALAAHFGHSRLWLHAWRLRLPHPLTGEPVQLQAEPSANWLATVGAVQLEAKAAVAMLGPRPGYQGPGTRNRHQQGPQPESTDAP